ncbi:hypothetical protein BC830DRAFT_708987 [Chytriomyces sp. MP71]|nr:hypothetical protein BC830DRAFT_708987 [Chytriomyces sp. MP71]
MADFRAFNNPGLQGGASSKHWSGEPMDWSNSLGSRSFSNSQPLYGSKRDLWELGSREAGLEAGKVEAGGEPIKAELDELAHPGTSYSYAQRYTKGTARPDLDTNSPTLTPVPSPDALVQPQPPPQPPSASSRSIHHPWAVLFQLKVLSILQCVLVDL